MAEDEFWELTLKELNALIERRIDNQDWLNYRSALICAVLANTVRDTKRKPRPFVPDDFMPKQESRRQTPKQILATVKILNAAFGGKVEK